MKPPTVDPATSGAPTVVAQHHAMATLWEIRLPAEEEPYARQAAAEAFREVERMENLLSRFREGGDVWCLNHLPAGGELQLSEETAACLTRALEIQTLTNGAFHPGLGGVMDRVRAGESWEQSLTEINTGCLELAEDSTLVRCTQEGMRLDLGAIGKGFTLERVHALLVEWGFSAMLLSAGGSSVLAAGQPWEMRLRGDSIRPTVTLRDLAVGSSGSSVQGQHIIDVRRGTRETAHLRSWAICERAADADALSTATLQMEADEIEQTLAAFGAPCVIVLETFQDNRIVRRQFSSSESFAAGIGLNPP